MRLRDRRSFTKPEVMIIPMIDIMFFLLVFFMISTLYMVNLKTVDVNMPKAASAQTQMNVTYLVTLKKDGTLYLEDQPIEEKALIKQAQQENRSNNHLRLSCAPMRASITARLSTSSITSAKLASAGSDSRLMPAESEAEDASRR